MKKYNKYSVLSLSVVAIALCVASVSASASILKGIDPPKPKIYTCPVMPNPFKVGDVMFEDDVVWRSAVPGIVKGSNITIEPSKGDKPVNYTNGAVDGYLFGKILMCYGKMTVSGKEYLVKVKSRVRYKNCTWEADKKAFFCKDPT